MGSPKSGTRGALHARCSRLWGMFQVPSGMHTVLLLSTLAWLCYLGAWLLLDVSLGNHLQVSPVPGLRTWLQIPRPYIGHNPVCQAHPQLAPCDCTRHASLACFCCLVQCTALKPAMLQASHSYVATNWNSYYAGRTDASNPSPRCCSADSCTQNDRGRYTILTTLRTDKYLPLLQVSWSCRFDISKHTMVGVNSV